MTATGDMLHSVEPMSNEPSEMSSTGAGALGTGQLDMRGLYFGYGSNLSSTDWQAFCHRLGHDPSCLKPVGPAWLPGRELAFTRFSSTRAGGVLDVRPSPGCVVSGWLYQANESGWRLLHVKEGAAAMPAAYDRIPCVVHLPGGQPVKAHTYEVSPQRRQDFVAPSSDYLSICMSARRDLGVETAELEEASRGGASRPLDMLFVYGTLLPGQERHRILADANVTEMQSASVGGRMVDHRAFPGLIPGGPARAHGVLVRMSDTVSLLRVLDRVEGFMGHGHPDNLFVRAPVDVQTENGVSARAWTYLGPDPTLPMIASGCWRSHVAAHG